MSPCHEIPNRAKVMRELEFLFYKLFLSISMSSSFDLLLSSLNKIIDKGTFLMISHKFLKLLRY